MVAHYTLYGETAAPVRADFVHVERIADRSSLYEWTIDPHIHAGIFQVLFLTGQESLLVADDSNIQLIPPCIVTVPCGSLHAFRFQPEAQGWVLSVADALLQDPAISSPGLVQLLQQGKVNCVRLASRDTQSLLEAALEMLAAPQAVSDRERYFSLALILALIERVSIAPNQSGSAVPDRRLQLFRRFNQLLEKHFREHRTLTLYARELGATVQTLTRACNYAVGKSPGDLVHDRMMREAMQALAFSVAGIGDIADHLGFTDLAYFSRFFKARAGLSPSAFRREQAWKSQTGIDAGRGIAV